MRPSILKGLQTVCKKIMGFIPGKAPQDDIDEFVDPKFIGYGTTADKIIYELKGVITQIHWINDQQKTEGMEF